MPHTRSKGPLLTGRSPACGSCWIAPFQRKFTTADLLSTPMDLRTRPLRCRDSPAPAVVPGEGVRYRSNDVLISASREDEGVSMSQRTEWINSGAFQVAPGVHRIPLPLPSDGLRAVNVYAIEHAEGLVLIDGGWALEESRRQLETSLKELGFGLADISRFLVTHVHRDHYTQAIAVRKEFGTRVRLGIGERHTLEVLTGPQAPDRSPQLEQLRVCGAGPVIGRQRAPEAAPLGSYLESMKIARELPDLPLLPAHGPVTESVHDRGDALLEHHAERLDACAAAGAAGAGTAYETARALTWTRRERLFDDLDVFNQLLATTEPWAHLEVLVAQGRQR